FKAAVRGHGAGPRPGEHPGLARLRLGPGPVTAACAAAESRLLLVGFADGSLAGLDPAGEPIRLRREGTPPWPVVAVAADPRGDVAVALRASPGGGAAELCAYMRIRYARSSWVYAARHWREVPTAGAWGLTQVLAAGDLFRVGLW